MATILVADDHATNRDYLTSLLGYKGHRLLEARDGREALDLAVAEDPDLVITDLHMPEVDGYELTHLLRSDARTAGMPVIFVSGNYREAEARSLAEKLGVTTFLAKPAEPQAVLDAVEAALASSPGPLLLASAENFDQAHFSLLNEKLARDIEELEEARRLLAASEERYRMVSELMSDCAFAFLFGPDGSVTPEWMAGDFERLWGYTPQEVRELGPAGIVDPQDLAGLALLFEGVLRGEAPSAELRARRKDGVVRWMRARLAPWWDEEGRRVVGFYAGLRDITEDRETEEAIRLAEARYRELVENANDVIYAADLVPGAGMRVTFVSPQMWSVLGHDPERFVADPLAWPSMTHPDDLPKVQAWLGRIAAGENTDAFLYRIRHGATGEYRWIETKAVARRSSDGRVVGTLGISRDVTDRVQREDELRHRSLHDALTGLPNRVLLLDRLQQGLARLSRFPGKVAVLALDLDGFKGVNDSLGHDQGDHLLLAVGERLRNLLRPADTVARMGGDEFAILLEGLDEASQVEGVAQRVLDAFQDPFEAGGGEVFVGASIGIRVGGADESPSTLLRDADLAMYEAKRRGKATRVTFDALLESGARARMGLDSQLRRGLRDGEFRVQYQPIVELACGRLVGAEALVRWQHPERGLVSPADFIPVAEESGLIVPLGRFVLEEACRQLVAWRGSHADSAPAVVSVNLSPRQLQDPTLVSFVARCLEETGLHPGHLSLEITETAVAADPQKSAAVLGELRALGVSLAIDDFGTGYSSLGQLARIPVQYLKMPKEFVDGIDLGGHGATVAGSIVRLATSLGLDVVAEGIERAEQASAAAALGCRYGQGYWFSRPLTPEAFSSTLDDRRHHRESPAGVVRLGTGAATAATATTDATDVLEDRDIPRSPRRRR